MGLSPCGRTRRPATSALTPASPATAPGDVRPRPAGDNSGYSNGGCGRWAPRGPAYHTAGTRSRQVGVPARVSVPPIGAVAAPGCGPGWRGSTPAGSGPPSKSGGSSSTRRHTVRAARRTPRRCRWCAGGGNRAAGQEPPRPRCPWWKSSGWCGRRSGPFVARSVAPAHRKRPAGVLRRGTGSPSGSRRAPRRRGGSLRWPAGSSPERRA
jgi:hypothetical protein